MRTKIGTISSAKMQGTVVVTVHRYMMHAKYAKRFRISKKFMSDANGHQLNVGDEVMIAECRPLSKNKHFKVVEIKKRAIQFGEMKVEDIEKTVKRDHRDRLHTDNSSDSSNSSDVQTPESGVSTIHSAAVSK